MSKWSESIVFTQLGLKEGQTWTQLKKNCKINRYSYAKGVIGLKKKKLIRKENNLYYIKSKIKNPMLLEVKGAYTRAKKLEIALQIVREAKNPFDLGFMLIWNVMRFLVMLKIEQYTIIRLTPREKDEFENLIVLYTEVLEQTFKILRKNNPKRMMKLKKALNIAMFNPNLLSSMKRKNTLDNLTN